jgi:hypothetical protein
MSQDTDPAIENDFQSPVNQEPVVEYISADPLNRDPNELIEQTVKAFGHALPSMVAPETEKKEQPSSETILEQVTITLLTSDVGVDKITTEDCSLWVSLCRNQGQLTPSSLLNINSIAEIFDDVSDEGISGGGPLLLTDTDFTPHRMIYFSELGQNSHEWIEETTRVVKTLKKKTLGLYLAPSLVHTDMQQLIQGTIERLVTLAEINHFYLVRSNPASLNAAHQSRTNLKGKGYSVRVQH